MPLSTELIAVPAAIEGTAQRQQQQQQISLQLAITSTSSGCTYQLTGSSTEGVSEQHGAMGCSGIIKQISGCNKFCSRSSIQRQQDQHAKRSYAVVYNFESVLVIASSIRSSKVTPQFSPRGYLLLLCQSSLICCMKHTCQMQVTFVWMLKVHHVCCAR